MKSYAKEIHTSALDIHNYTSNFCQLRIDVCLLFLTQLIQQRFESLYEISVLKKVVKRVKPIKKVIIHLQEETSAVLR